MSWLPIDVRNSPAWLYIAQVRVVWNVCALAFILHLLFDSVRSHAAYLLVLVFLSEWLFGVFNNSDVWIFCVFPKNSNPVRSVKLNALCSLLSSSFFQDESSKVLFPMKIQLNRPSFFRQMHKWFEMSPWIAIWPFSPFDKIELRMNHSCFVLTFAAYCRILIIKSRQCRQYRMREFKNTNSITRLSNLVTTF